MVRPGSALTSFPALLKKYSCGIASRLNPVSPLPTGLGPPLVPPSKSAMTTQSRAAEAGRDSRDFLLMGLLCAVFPDDPDGAGPPSFRTASEISWDLS